MKPCRWAAVFCGSMPGSDPQMIATARDLGRRLAQAQIGLVYGGGGVGLMGAVAEAVLGGGGSVIGVMPEFLMKREAAQFDCTELIITTDMHTRKQRMAELADAFITMPGGFGTFDETFEILTWRQLKLHDKPILIANIAGWAKPLVDLLEATVTAGFAHPGVRSLYQVVDSPAGIIAALAGLPTAKPMASELT